MNDSNIKLIKPIVIGTAIAIGLSFFIDRFFIQYIIIWTDEILMLLSSIVWPSFFAAYTIMSGIICFILLYLLKMVLGRAFGIEMDERAFILSLGSGALIYAVASAIYESTISELGLDRFIYITLMWIVAGALFYIFCYVRKKLIKDDEDIDEAEAESIDSDVYRVHYARMFYKWFLVVYFIIFTVINVMLININGWTKPVLIFAFCDYGFVILLTLVMSSVMKDGYLLEVDHRGITIKYRRIGFIPWEDIAGFEIYKAYKVRYYSDILGIKIKNEEKYMNSMSRFGRLMTKQRKLFSDSMFEIDFDFANELLPTAIDEIKKRAPKTVKTNQSGRCSSLEIVNYNETRQKISKVARRLLLSLVVANVLIYLIDFLYSIRFPYYGSQLIIDALLFGPEIDMGAEFFGIDTNAIMHGEYYRLFTHAFLHVDIIHLVLNMLALVLIGSELLCEYNKRTVTIWYIAGILGGGLADVLAAAITRMPIYSIGASGAIFGLLGGKLASMTCAALQTKGSGTGIRAADRRKLFEYTSFVLVMVLLSSFKEGISWEGHLGGLLGGLVVGALMGAKQQGI